MAVALDRVDVAGRARPRTGAGRSTRAPRGRPRRRPDRRSGAASGADDVAGRLDARVEQDRRSRRRPAGCPAFRAAACPSRCGRPDDLDAVLAERRQRRLLVGRRSVGARRRSCRSRRDRRRGAPATARSTSSGQSVATMMTLAATVAVSSSRDGTDALEPYRTIPSSTTSGGRRGRRSKSTPRSMTVQPPASMVARSSSARVKSRASRADRRRWARSRISGGTCGRVTTRG